MKTITVRDLQKKVRECVDAAQSDRIVITRHGKPAADKVNPAGDPPVVEMPLRGQEPMPIGMKKEGMMKEDVKKEYMKKEPMIEEIMEKEEMKN